MTIAIILSSIVLLFVISVYFANSYNAQVTQELKDNPEGGRASQVMLISLPDGKSTPVNYLQEGDTVFAASDFNWWRKVEGDTELQLLIRGENLSGIANVSDDVDYTYEVFERLRPDAPTWASRLVGAKLVEIRLGNQQARL